MELITDDELRLKVHELATDRNLTDKELMEEAIMIYREYLKLLDEFQMWDDISDKDLMGFEKNYGNSNSRDS
jgi:predicted transcriptional regulator